MKQTYTKRLFLILAAVAMFCIGANATTYTYDFSSNKNWVTTSGGSTNPGTGTANVLGTIYDKTTNDAFSCTESCYFNTGYLMLKNGATMTLPTYAGEKITSVVITNSSGCSTKTKVSILAGTNVASAEQTLTTTSTNYTFNIGSSYQSSVLTFSIASANSQFTKVVVNTESTSTATAKAPAISAEGNEFSESLDVTINNNETGATVYYTTNGNDPTTSSSSFTGSSKVISISATTTVKAMAVIAGKTNSSVVSATYTKIASCANIAEFKALASGTKAMLTLTDAVVTYVNGSDHYVQDATGGIDLYGSGMSYAVGDVLNGTVSGTYTLYNGTPEVANGATYSVTKTTGGTVAPTLVTIEDLTGSHKADYACMKVKLNNVSYSEGNIVDEEGSTIKLYDKGNILASYVWPDQVNFVGVFCNYQTSTTATPELFPISADLIESIAGKPAPTTMWQFVAYIGTANNLPAFTTKSDGNKVYKSSNTDIATIASNGSITMKGSGETTISCYANQSSAYKVTQPAEYALLVEVAGEKDIINFNDRVLPDGWSKTGGAFDATTNHFYTSAPGLSLGGATQVATLTSKNYFNILGLTFYASTSTAGDGKSISIKYSTDGSNWSVLDNVALSKGAMQQYTISQEKIALISNLGQVSLQFESNFNTPYLDDIVITYTKSQEIAAPVFSKESGICNEPFNLTITNPNTADGSYEIYYTTDNSDPRSSATKQKYTSVISISSSTMVRAYIYYLDSHAYEFKSEETTASYYFPAGKGTAESPYTIGDAINVGNAISDACWVTGIIVDGNAAAVSSTNETGIVEKDETVTAHIVLSEDGTANVVNLPVKLAVSPIRNWINIGENPANIGKTIKVYGKFGNYFSRCGMTEVSKIVIGDYTYTTVWGDADADGKLTANDISEVVQVLVTGNDHTGGMSDISGDRKTTISDLTSLIKKLIP